MNKTNVSISLIFILLTLSCAGQNKNILSPKEFQAEMGKTAVTLLDVRTPGEFKSGHLDKAVNIDIKGSDFETQSAQLDKAKPVLVYCLAGSRSAAAANVLRKKGYTVLELKGGINAWQEEGLPVSSK